MTWKLAFILLISCFVSCISLHAKLSPEEEARLASLAEKVGELYQSGKFAEAIPVAQESLALAEKALGPDHPESATLVNNLAELYRSMGEYAKAQALFQRALKIDEKALGPDHPNVARDLNNLALLYKSKGEYGKVESLYQRALKIQEKALGRDDPTVATYLNNLATLSISMGNYAKAKPLLQRALEIDEKALGPDHPETATDLNNLALLCNSMGDYAKAEPLFQRALSINEKALGPDHPTTATTLTNLAELYRLMNDYAKAEPLFRRALQIDEKALGPDHPATATDLNNLAVLCDSIGDYAKAEPLYRRALEIREKALGPTHPSTATTLNNLALVYKSMNEFAEAELLLRRALQIDEEALGANHPGTATDLNNLALVYRSIGDYAKAEPLFQRALQIDRKALGQDHPDTARDLNNLAVLNIDLGKPKDAMLLANQARLVEEKHLSNILSFTSEEQRLAFHNSINPYSVPGTLGDAAELAEIVLRQKGLVLDSLLEDRLVAEASGDPKQRLVIEQLRAAKQRLTQLRLEVPKDLSEQGAKQLAIEREHLSTQVERFEAGLARQVAGLGKARRALSVTVAQVQAVLAKQATLVELVRYHHYLGKNNWELRYGGIVIPRGGQPTWVTLGAAAEIEKNVVRYQKSVRGNTNEATLRSVLKALHAQVWAPIEKALPEASATVIVSPDAELNFVSLATLLSVDDQFVAEKYSVRYVASGRDLLRKSKPAVGAKNSLRVFANPAFAASGPQLPPSDVKTNAVALRSTEMRELQRILLPDLPGTEKESAQLEAQARTSGWQVQTTVGSNATEAALRKSGSPRILHLATHGFFLPETNLGSPPNAVSQSQAETRKGQLVNPMHRSGLALTGAQSTLQAWGRGEVPTPDDDGIVTAEEVGGLKLADTWLVVLSACETGSGEAKAGEGVMGLRRGFVQAGGQNLLMTLWPISDETTVQIMLDFYSAAFKDGNAPYALTETQRNWLMKLRKERGLLQAVRLAGPFIMSSQGIALP
jgi:tetratricopeptide (TPR) repeat protein